MKDRDFVINILNNLENSSNKDLTKCMDILNEDFEVTKSSIINLTHHLDNVEVVYDKILTEFKKRNDVRFVQ